MIEVKSRIRASALSCVKSAVFWEEATVNIDGHADYVNGGCVNEAVVFGYLHPTGDKTGTVTTFSGNVTLGRYFITSQYRQWNPFSHHHEAMTCYRVITPDRRVFFGRNGGIDMLLKCRRSKSLTTKLRKRLAIPEEA